MQFNDLPVADGTKDAVAAMGYEEATPIQRQAIPILLAGRDLIGRAQTGTGKTAAFGIPLIDALRDDARRNPGVRGLVLCPTRELALQVTEVLRDIARGSDVRVVPVYGGAGFDAQIRGLQANTAIVCVACPGRLLDLVQRGDAHLGAVKVLVLDEADRMLDMGFINDMKRIRDLVPRDRQTSLFSATFDARMKKVAADFLRDPEIVEVADQTLATALTTQYHVRVEKSDKQTALLALLHRDQPAKAVVFTRTKHLAKRLADRLNKTGWASVALQGNMTQGQRERAMDAFRNSKARVLVATDVAARGLDVPDITHVVNYDLPMEPEMYVHRVGRTGRNGQTGTSYTFVQSDEHRDWRTIEQLAGTRIDQHHVAIENAPSGPDAPVILSPPRQGGGRRPRPSGPRGDHGARRGPARTGGRSGRSGRSRRGGSRGSGGRRY